MVTIFIVVSPSGKVAYAGDKEWAANQFKPYDYSLEQGYDCFIVQADTPWRLVEEPEPEPQAELGES